MTARSGVPDPVVDVRAALGPHLDAALSAEISAPAFRVFTAILLRLSDRFFSIGEAADAAAIKEGSAVQIVGRLATVGLLGSRRRTFYEGEKRVDKLLYFVPSVPGRGDVR